MQRGKYRMNKKDWWEYVNYLQSQILIEEAREDCLNKFINLSNLYSDKFNVIGTKLK